MSTGRFLHFAYASNMLKERMLCYNPTALKIFRGPAKLENYRLAFCRDWPLPGVWHGPTANLRKSPGSHVWGVIWELEDKVKAELDSQEHTHQGLDLEVTDLRGNKFTCYAFAMRESQGQEEPPSPQYKDVIVRGGQQSELPGEYIQTLKDLPDNGFTGRVAVYEDVLAILKGKF
ncbi:gamma-glutamylcyclotransferase-like [Haliotis asinina]|uniref:gamma-glutamylcyclotransferase-like n=1 Tax=Haliotis asinina TaxID=109174 RepID=UPI003531C1C7